MEIFIWLCKNKAGSEIIAKAGALSWLLPSVCEYLIWVFVM